MGNIPFINYFRADSLEQIINYIHQIPKPMLGTDPSNNGSIPPIWFRGHEYANYMLLPGLMRGNDIKIISKGSACSTLQHQEDERYQGFRAKNNLLFSEHPDNRVDWEELMQHHFVKTRMMDWSESLQTALAFALESLLIPENNADLQHRRSLLEPVIWVLLPHKLNKIVYDTMCDRDLFMNALRVLVPNPYKRCMLAKSLVRHMSTNPEFLFSAPDKTQLHPALNQMVSLSVINQQREQCGHSLLRSLINFEFNPFFFILSRYYSDGLPSIKNLPPLAVLHPYHSDRIRAQQGAFTMFPVNVQASTSTPLVASQIPMELLPSMNQCLFEIRITNPSRVVRELLLTGVRHSNLYPEPSVYAKDLEATQYYL